VSLLSRVVEATSCKVVDCTEPRARDAQVCAKDLTELYMKRLDRQPDGTFIRRRQLRARDETWSAA
jgi:hypothetical protein